MLILLFFVYLFVLLYPFWVKKDLPKFHPSKIASIFYIFYTVPFLLVLINDNYEIIHEYVLFKHKNIDELIIEYILTQMLGILFLYIGVFTPFKFGNKKSEIFFKHKNTFHFFFKTFLFFYLLGLTVFIYLVFSLGGIYQLILSANLRVTLFSGSNHLILLINTSLFLSVISLIKAISLKKINGIFILLIYALYFIMFSSFGGRSNFVLLILVSFFSYTMYFKEIRIFTIRNILVLLCLMSYIIIMPIIRVDFFSNTEGAFELIENNLITLAKGNEYISIQLSILGDFNYSNLWLGRSYLDFIYSFVPRSIFPDKPPVDEGVYFFNNMLGDNFKPKTPARKMVLVSWPPGTLGIMYSNFHLIGVAFGYFVLGLIYKYFYNKLLLSNFSIPFVYLYLYIVIKFELTNHYIFHLITIIVVLRITSFFQKKIN